jgi:hypothetical protein
MVMVLFLVLRECEKESSGDWVVEGKKREEGGCGRWCWQRVSREFEIAGAMWGNFVWRHVHRRNNAEMPNLRQVALLAWCRSRSAVEVVHLAPGTWHRLLSLLCLPRDTGLSPEQCSRRLSSCLHEGV